MTYGLVRLLLGPLVRLVWRVRELPPESVPAGPAVLVANHASLLDPLLLAAAVPRRLRFLAKEELFVPGVGAILRVVGAIPIGRGRGDREAFAAAAAALRAGEAVVFFPQGTVLGPADRAWHRGAARLALEAGAPLLPVAIVGAARALAPGRRLPRRARVDVLAGPALHVGPAAPTVASARAVTARVRAEVERLAAAGAPASA